MDAQFKSRHKTAKKKARLTKLKPLLHCSKKQLLHCCSMQAHHIIKAPARAKLEKFATASQVKADSWANNTRRQRRRNVVESRPRLVAGTAPAVVHRVQPETDSRIRKWRRQDACLHLPSIYAGSDLINPCRFYGGLSRYIVEKSAEASSTSIFSLGSRLCAENHVSGTAVPSACVENQPISGRNGRPSRPSELALSSCSPFSLPKLDASDAAAAGLDDKNYQCPLICLVLEPSPKAANEQLCIKKHGTKRLSSKSPDLISPLVDDVLMVNANGARTPASSVTVAAMSASSTSSSLLSQEKITFDRVNGKGASSGGPDMMNSIPSSPTLMFKQILKNHSWGLTPLIEAEMFNSQKFHFAKSEEDFEHMLDSLHERELDLPLLWGYLERSQTTGIYEPHRYFIVVWQIQHASKYKYQLDTLFRAVSLLDRCLCFGTHMVNRQTLWLIGVACMCIAAKLEETQFSSIISVMEDDCTEIGQKPCFTKQQIIWMETVVLHVVNYECLTPTAATFIWHYLWDFRKDKEVQTLAFSILCLSLTDYEALRFPASVISASAVFLTCIILNRVPSMLVMELQWTESAARSCVKGEPEIGFFAC